MERLFVNDNFKYVHVISIRNGQTWTIDNLAAQISTLYRARNMRPDYIFVWLDRETHDRSVSDLEMAVREALALSGVDDRKIFVLVPDRMTENVILSDEVTIRKEFGDDQYTYTYEGLGGKAILKKKYEENGETYRETYH